MGQVQVPLNLPGTYTWTAPEGVTSVFVEAVGGGGSGGSANAAGGRGGGGAGGCYVSATVTVTPNTAYTIVVGDYATSDTDGHDSTFDSTVVVAKGGAKGAAAVTGSLSGAAGAASTTGCVGDVIWAGGNGSAGVASTHAGSGGSGPSQTANGNDASGSTGGAPAGLYGGQGANGTTAAVDDGTQGLPYGSGGSGAAANSGTLHTGGTSGAGIVVLWFSVTDDVPTMRRTLACDAFTGGDDSDIDGRDLDGCGGTASGTWQKDGWGGTHPIQIVDGVATEFNGVILLDPDYFVTGLTLPATKQGARAWINFPSTDSLSTPCSLIWKDEFDGSPGDLDGRSHAGGSAGTGTYHRVDSYSGSGAAIELDGSGKLIQYAGGSPGSQNNAEYFITGLTLPTNYDIQVDIERTTDVGADGHTVGSVRIHARTQYSPPENTGLLSSFWCQYETDLVSHPDDKHGAWHAAAGGPIGALVTGSAVADPPGDQGIDRGEVKTIEVRVRGTAPTTCHSYFGATSCETGTPAISWFDGEFGAPRVNFTTGGIGLGMEVGGAGEENNYRIREIRVYEAGVIEEPLEYAYSEVSLEGLADTFQGYRFGLELVHFSATAGIFVNVWLYYVDEFGTLQGPLVYAPLPAPLPVGHLPYVQEFVMEPDPVTGHMALWGRINGQLVIYWDIDDSGIPLYTDGLPALYLHNEASSPTRLVECSRFEVLTEGAPCEGPPENPYPNEPPPPPPLPPIFLWLRKFGKWRAAMAPIPTLQDGTVSDRRHGMARLATTLGLRWHGKWRGLGVFDAETWPDPPTEFPPWFDPCQLLTPQGPGGVTLDTLTGRFFGMDGAPVSVTGDLFTATEFWVGSWTPDDLALAATQSSTLVTSLGYYSQYLLSGAWDATTFTDTTTAQLTPVLADLTGSGNYYGHVLIGDVTSTALWPPSGVPVDELATAVSDIRSACPGILLGVRADPRTFPTDPGFDFYEASYVSWRGETAYAFGREVYAAAVAYDADLILNLNYLQGGDGSSGIRYSSGTVLGAHYECSTVEILGYLTDLYLGVQAVDTSAPRLRGSLGWRYDPTFLGLPGVPDAMANARNALAALPALP